MSTYLYNCNGQEYIIVNHIIFLITYTFFSLILLSIRTPNGILCDDTTLCYALTHTNYKFTGSSKSIQSSRHPCGHSAQLLRVSWHTDMQERGYYTVTTGLKVDVYLVNSWFTRLQLGYCTLPKKYHNTFWWTWHDTLIATSISALLWYQKNNVQSQYDLIDTTRRSCECAFIALIYNTFFIWPGRPVAYSILSTGEKKI